jgi:hypothetical protein
VATEFNSLGVTSEAIDNNDKLFAGEFPRATKSVTVVSGSGVVVRGTVMGVITVGGKYAPYDNTASDGTEVARGILLEDVSAVSGDAPAMLWITGEYNAAALTWDAANDAAAILAGIADLEAINCYVKEVA